MADRVMMVFACAGAGCGCCFEAELDWDRLGTMARCPECGNIGHGTAARSYPEGCLRPDGDVEEES